ncbi:hypothetical protein HW932_03580 [Allochromatium humboldtianum]|uniref:Uncharacterized protein n=1 Tax=Allochromatium humboldtianum TaxID=504901 RepID=A0A850R7H3_9GAMM|nr:hypothetical protein [Allochromatium humboldtianum]NVZ08336.1 hypothetical protein [Allochromatium humboldtianum]
MNKFHADAVQTEQDRWLKFFTEGERQPDGDETPEKKKGLPSDIGNPFLLLAPWDGLEPPT